MANFNLTITNEGAAFLANIIATQGSVDFTEMRFSTTNYVGQEATLTEGAWTGTFITAAPSASVVDSTTINVAASFDNTTLTTPKDLYSIGLIGDDGNDTALVAVATTSDPAKISEFILNPSYYAYNFNLGVSSTSGITVTGSMAGALFVSDIVDNLTSSNTNKPLSAKQGKVLEDGKADKVTSATAGDFAGLDSSGNLTDSGKKAADFATDDEMSAVVNVYGAKNLLKNELYLYGASITSNSVTFTQLKDDTISMSGTASADTAISITPNWFYVPYSGEFTLSGGDAEDLSLVLVDHNGTQVAVAFGSDVTVTLDASEKYMMWIKVYNGTVTTGRKFYPMLRDARITDPTYVPYAKTNRELTVDKVERADLTDVNIMGTTNTSGRLITTGMHFYLNNQFCRAKVDISVNAAFTLGTNYVVESAYKDSGWIPATLNTTYFSSGGVWYRTIGEKCYVTFQGCVPIAAVDAIIATGLPKADTFFSGCASPENGSPGRAVFIQQNDTVLRTRLVDTQTLWGSIEYLMM